MNKLGVVIIGINGAVASTLIAGVELMVRGLTPRIGMVTEKGTAPEADSIASLLDLVPLDDLVFAGWDVRFDNVYEGALQHKVFSRETLAPIQKELEAIRSWPAVFSKPYAENVLGDHTLHAGSFRDEIRTIVRNVEEFRRTREIDRVVMGAKTPALGKRFGIEVRDLREKAITQDLVPCNFCLNLGEQVGTHARDPKQTSYE